MTGTERDLPADSGLAGLKSRIRTLEAELRALSGQIGNRSPAQEPDLEARNRELALKLDGLENRLFTLLTDNLKPRQSDEALQKAEVLRLATVEFCQQSQIDPELWKNIAF